MVNLWLIMVNHWNSNISGWWFGTFVMFPYIGNGKIIPTDELHYFSEGLVNHQPVKNILGTYLEVS